MSLLKAAILRAVGANQILDAPSLTLRECTANRAARSVVYYRLQRPGLLDFDRNFCQENHLGRGL
jgi:hypothetical protein